MASACGGLEPEHTVYTPSDSSSGVHFPEEGEDVLATT